jgi:ribosomal protein L29
MAKEKGLNDKEIEKKVMELKINLLKQSQKRKSLKKAIARLLTMKNQNKLDGGKK